MILLKGLQCFLKARLHLPLPLPFRILSVLLCPPLICFAERIFLQLVCQSLETILAMSIFVSPFCPMARGSYLVCIVWRPNRVSAEVDGAGNGSPQPAAQEPSQGQQWARAGVESHVTAIFEAKMTVKQGVFKEIKELSSLWGWDKSPRNVTNK